MNRRRRLDFLGSILLLLSISGFGGAAMFFQSDGSAVAPALQRVSPTLEHWILVLASLAYAGSGASASLGIFRRSSWALQAYTVWAVSIASFVLFFLYIAPIPLDTFTFVGLPLFLGVGALGVVAGHRQIVEGRNEGLFEMRSNKSLQRTA